MRHFVTFLLNNFLTFTPEIENIPDIPCPGMNVYKSNKIADGESSEEKTRLSPTATLETNNNSVAKSFIQNFDDNWGGGNHNNAKTKQHLDKVFMSQMGVAPRYQGAVQSGNMEWIIRIMIKIG